MKKQKGITLIALIITIVVLMILAVVTINAVRDGGIIQHAQDAASEYTIAQEKEQIGLGYSEYLINKNITEDAELKVEGATVTGSEEEGVVVEFQKTGNRYSVSKNGVITSIKDEEDGGENPSQPDGGEDPDDSIIHADIIPEGGVYKRVAEDGTETQYVAGQAFPETVLDGDIYIFEDYEYRYNYVCFDIGETLTWIDIQAANQELASNGITLSIGGWGVRVTDATKTEYTDMITTINGKDVTNLTFSYAVCTNLVSTPELSSKTKDMTFAFYACTGLTTVSNLPDSVISLNSTFLNCYELTTVSNLPDGVTNLRSTFDQCYMLASVPAIPRNVTNMERTFGACESLTGEIEINANPSEYEKCFYETNKTIKITGTASETTKQGLAATSNINNIEWE